MKVTTSRKKPTHLFSDTSYVELMTFPANGNSDPAAIIVGAISSAAKESDDDDFQRDHLHT